MRLGATIAKPALMMKTMRYDGGMVSYALPTPSVVCGTAGLLAGEVRLLGEAWPRNWL